VEAIGVGVFFLLFFGVFIGSFVVWIWGIVDVCRIPDHQYRAAGTEKVMWVLVVVLVQAIGAIIWYFVKRKDVLAAAYGVPAPPPGWYPDPSTGVARWWDGARWSEVQHAPPPPSG
jgi:hypothetical protein